MRRARPCGVEPEGPGGSGSHRRARSRARRPDVIVTTTAFSARDDGSFVLDEADCPILQAIPVGSVAGGWAASPRGLSAADMAMQVALPEFDGRIAAAPISFKARTRPRSGARLRTAGPDARSGRHRRGCRSRPPPGSGSPVRPLRSDGSPSCCPITRPAAAARASRSASTRRQASALSSKCSRAPATGCRGTLRPIP